MKRLNYDPLMAQWKVDLIRARAVHLGLGAAELPDLLQELVPVVAAFRYDPTRANGANEKTALRAIVDNQLKAARRAHGRYRAQLARLAAEPRPEADDLTPVWRAADVHAVVALLPAREQRVCRALADGEDCMGVARLLGCSWHCARRLIARIRAHFIVYGLDHYCCA